jgi:hypothetical protein
LKLVSVHIADVPELGHDSPMPYLVSELFSLFGKRIRRRR